jgi:(E)-2-((N-methylformamido)methylene)succinate hydrolase
MNMAELTLPRNDAPVLHYWAEGQGPAVLLIHGVGADGTSWDRIAKDLRPRFQVLRLDLRGHGRSAPIEGPLSLDDFVQDVVDVLTTCGRASAHIVGFSLGGIIAQAMALHHPDKVDGLVLLSAVAGRTPAERERVRQRLEVLRSDGISAITGAAQVRWFTPAFIVRHPEIVQRRMEQLRQNHPESYAAAYTVFSTSDLGEQLHAISKPTLIATGEHDPGSNPRMAEYMHRQIAGSRLEILPGLRHSILLEAPAVVSRLLLDFLSEITATLHYPNSDAMLRQQPRIGSVERGANAAHGME